jgi:hypothetical protein
LNLLVIAGACAAFARFRTRLKEIWGMRKQALRHFGFGTESRESLYCLQIFPVARVVFLTALIEAES